jgi:hypothetical protein
MSLWGLTLGWTAGALLGPPGSAAASSSTMITWLDVVKLEAGLSTVPLDWQTEILTYVHEVVGVQSLGGEASPRLKMVRRTLAAHFGKLYQQLAGGLTTGPVTSRSMGGISKSMLSAGMTEDGLQRTGHGSLYLFVVRSAPKCQGFIA